MTSANKSLEKKNFHQVENIIKQLVHTPSVRSSRYEAIMEPFFCLITFNCVSVLHISIVHAHDISKQIPRKKKFPSGWKYYKRIGSYTICAFIEIWSTWEVWRALKKLELLSATPWATLTHISCSLNFLRASYLDERTLTYEPIVILINLRVWYFSWSSINNTLIGPLYWWSTDR